MNVASNKAMWAPPPTAIPRQVRSLACGCMSKLFAAGDILPLYSRASALLGELSDGKGGASSEVRRAGVAAPAGL